MLGLLQTNEELDMTMTRCGKVKAKSDEANAKATAERKLIAQDLCNAQKDLTDIRWTFSLWISP